jgi:hypothetical protein
MELTWGIAAIWLGLALVASLLSIRFKMSVALVEILVGVVAGNLALLLEHYHLFGLHWELKPNEWIAFLAGFGSILLTFMAGAEIEPSLLRKSLKETLCIGFASFLAPFLGAMLYARFVTGWDWNASLICGIALSTTSVAVVYAVMIETGLNETELGKLILAACFVTDLGTVVALGICFANYNWTLALFAVVAVIVLWLAPGFVNWFFSRYSTHMSEPGVKFVFFVLFGLGSLAAFANSEAVLPAYLVGLGLAGVFARQRETVRRLRTTVFALLRQHAGIGLPAPRCRPLDDAVGLGSGGYFVSCVLPYAVLFPQCGHEGLPARPLGRLGAGGDPPGGEDRHEGHWRLAAGPRVWSGSAGEQLHHSVDVYGTDLRHHQRPLWTEQRLHQQLSILGPRDRGHCQRRRADGDCPDIFPAAGRARGGIHDGTTRHAHMPRQMKRGLSCSTKS